MKLIDYKKEANAVADETQEPMMVTWLKTKHIIVPAAEYRAAEHGCCESVHYPKDYEYPHPDAIAVLDENLELW